MQNGIQTIINKTISTSPIAVNVSTNTVILWFFFPITNNNIVKNKDNNEDTIAPFKRKFPFVILFNRVTIHKDIEIKKKNVGNPTKTKSSLR